MGAKAKLGSWDKNKRHVNDYEEHASVSLPHSYHSPVASSVKHHQYLYSQADQCCTQQYGADLSDFPHPTNNKHSRLIVQSKQIDGTHRDGRKKSAFQSDEYLSHV